MAFSTADTPLTATAAQATASTTAAASTISPASTSTAGRLASATSGVHTAPAPAAVVVKPAAQPSPQAAPQFWWQTDQPATDLAPAAPETTAAAHLSNDKKTKSSTAGAASYEGQVLFNHDHQQYLGAAGE